MTSSAIIDKTIEDVIEKEGGEKETNDPSDSGGRTKYGISESANPKAWEDGDVSLVEAKDIYKRTYVLKEHFNLIEDPWLFQQVVDFGVPSGPETSAKVLQQLVGVTTDGDIGPATIKAIDSYPSGKLFGVQVPGFVLLNLAFRDARIMHYATVTKRRPKDLKYLLGWLKRAMSFK